MGRLGIGALVLLTVVVGDLSHSRADEHDSPTEEILRRGCMTLSSSIPGATPVDQYRFVEERRDYWRSRSLALNTTFRNLRTRPMEPRNVWEAALEAARGRAEMATAQLGACNARLDDLAARSMVELWSELNGGGLKKETVSIRDIVSSPTCRGAGFVRSNKAFASDRAFQLWLKDNGSQNVDRAAFATSRNPQIKTCIAQAGEGGRRSVSYERNDLCRERFGPDIHSGGPVGYRLHVRNGVVEVEHSIAFDYTGPEANRAEVFRRLEKARVCAENFYASQGLVLKLAFSSGSSKGADVSVEVHQDSSRTRPFEDEWPVFSSDQQSDQRLCGIAAHEIGHQLGLNDQYHESDCPHREHGTDGDNLMYFGDSNIDRAFLDGEQLNRILRPLCSGG